MFPFTDRLETKGNPVDMFLCTYVDMFPQTGELSDIKMNVSSHVETVVLLEREKVDGEESFLPNETTGDAAISLSRIEENLDE